MLMKLLKNKAMQHVGISTKVDIKIATIESTIDKINKNLIELVKRRIQLENENSTLFEKEISALKKLIDENLSKKEEFNIIREKLQTRKAEYVAKYRTLQIRKDTLKLTKNSSFDVELDLKDLENELEAMEELINKGVI